MKLRITKEQYDRLISEIVDSELVEQEGDAEGSPDVPSYDKWQTGLERGPANQVDNTKWEDIVTPSRGKANPIP